nr:MAG TPA: hypothetical protein [Caudoviricetes sp.]
MAFSLDFTGLDWQPIIIFWTSFVLDNFSFVGLTVKTYTKERKLKGLFVTDRGYSLRFSAYILVSS